MKCPACNNNLTYLQSEENDGIIEFYQCDNCEKLIAISDNNVEE